MVWLGLRTAGSEHTRLPVRPFRWGIQITAATDLHLYGGVDLAVASQPKGLTNLRASVAEFTDLGGQWFSSTVAQGLERASA